MLRHVIVRLLVVEIGSMVDIDRFATYIKQIATPDRLEGDMYTSSIGPRISLSHTCRSVSLCCYSRRQRSVLFDVFLLQSWQPRSRPRDFAGCSVRGAGLCRLIASVHVVWVDAASRHALPAAPVRARTDRTNVRSALLIEYVAAKSSIDPVPVEAIREDVADVQSSGILISKSRDQHGVLAREFDKPGLPVVRVRGENGVAQDPDAVVGVLAGLGPRRARIGRARIGRARVGGWAAKGRGGREGPSRLGREDERGGARLAQESSPGDRHGQLQ